MNSKQLCFFLGRPLSPLYSITMHLRALFYQKNYFKTYRLPVPVISVGNLTLGGTGKTPVVQYLARLLQEKGYNPAIISRGYGGTSREAINIVSNGSELLLDATTGGDESCFLAETLPGIPVLTGVVRRLPAEHALKMGANVLLLDDGFQHMQLARDLNLVLFKTDILAGNSRVFPGGELREPVKALKRATKFIMTDVYPGNRERAEQFTSLLHLKFPEITTEFATYEMNRIVQLDNNDNISPTEHSGLHQKSTYGFCGIAHPHAFKQTLKQQKFNVVGFCGLSDHVKYTDQRISTLLANADKVGAEALVTTEKDLVKFKRKTLPLPLYALRMETKFNPAFDQYVLETIQR